MHWGLPGPDGCPNAGYAPAIEAFEGELLMEHNIVTARQMTEKYLLDELDPAERDEFEEHYFNCAECAVDVKSAALLVEQIRDGAIPDHELRAVPAQPPIPKPSRWLAWLRPAFAVPVMATLLAVVGYQNLVTYPQMARQLTSPQVLPWASVNVGTYGSSGPAITVKPGQGFVLFVRIPPDGGYSHYTTDLYNPAGKLEWSGTILASSTPEASSTSDQWAVQVPGGNREAGSYVLAVHGVTASGERKDVGRTSFDLQIHK
jgi:Putative zinc-finger